MAGKVFPDSSGVHEDMAKILFDYYKGVAESIVAQEIEFENRIANVQEDIAASASRKQKSLKKNAVTGIALALIGGFTMFASVLFGLVIILTGLYFGLQLLLAKKKEDKFIEACHEKERLLENDKASIRRDFKVHRLGVAWVPVATRIPFQGQSFLMDNTGTLPRHKFVLYDIKDKDGLASTAGKLEEILTTIPAVDTTEDSETLDTSALSASIPRLNLGDWASSLDRNVRKLNYTFSNLNEASVEIPIIEPASDLAAFLAKHGEDEAPEELKVKLFNTNGLQGAVSSFDELAELSKSRSSGEGKSVEDFCRSIMEKAAVTLQLVSDARGRSLEKVNQYGLQSLGMLMKGSFNYYSPELESENIAKIREEKFNFADASESWEPLILNKSSRVSYDLLSDNWVAEDGSRTSNPYGIHQIFEEIFMPMVSSFMQENRLERLKVYNDIRNQKIDYLNQWHRDTDDFYARNRAEINELSNRIRSLTADYLSDLNTYKSLAQAVSGMETSGQPERIKEIAAENDNIAVMLSQAQIYSQFIEGFNTRFENFRQQIGELAQEFEHIEFFEASLRDGEARDAAQALVAVDWEERRRVLLRLGHQIAKGSNLPPEPSIEDRAQMDSMINLIAMYENLKSELDQEEKMASRADAQARVPIEADTQMVAANDGEQP